MKPCVEHKFASLECCLAATVCCFHHRQHLLIKSLLNQIFYMCVYVYVYRKIIDLHIKAVAVVVKLPKTTTRPVVCAIAVIPAGVVAAAGLAQHKC